MHFFDFLQTSQTHHSNKKRKRKKAAATAVGLLLVCVSISLSACVVGEDVAERPQGSSEEISENADHLKDLDESAVNLSVESQTQQSEEQETQPPLGSTDEPQTESSEDAEPVLTEEHEFIYEGIKLFFSGTYGTFWNYEDDHADLYMRRLRDHTGEYIELSLWRDQEELWHTVNENPYKYSDSIEELCEPVFYKKPSRRFDLDQRMCYYVVEVDGMNYLMQYSVESTADAVTMSYAVFGTSYIVHPLEKVVGFDECLDFGSMTVYLASDGAVDPAVSFPIEQMIAFADTVRGYMEKGQFVISTLHGVYELGVSEDRNNPVSPYLYDIFPWIPELAAACGVNTEGIRSAKQVLTAIQGALPIDPSLAMPDVAADGTYFITGDYYGESDESYLTVRIREDGSYVGELLIFRSLYLEFTGNYDNGILTVTPIDDDYFQLEISFQNGRATATFTDVEDDELGLFDVGESYTMDRNAKPYELRYLKEAEERPGDPKTWFNR